MCDNGSDRTLDPRMSCSCVNPSLHALFFLCIFLIVFWMTSLVTVFKLNFFLDDLDSHFAFSLAVGSSFSLSSMFA